MELKSTLLETIAGNEDLERISIALEKRHGFRADKVLNKLYDSHDGNEVLIRCFSDTGANEGVVTILKRGMLTQMVKEQIMFYINEGEYGMQCHLLTENENKDYNSIIDEIVTESFTKKLKA